MERMLVDEATAAVRAELETERAAHAVMRQALSRILTQDHSDDYGTDAQIIEGVQLLMRQWQSAVDAARPLFQSGGRWAHLLTAGQSITTAGPQALSEYAEQVERERDTVDRDYREHTNTLAGRVEECRREIARLTSVRDRLAIERAHARAALEQIRGLTDDPESPWPILIDVHEIAEAALLAPEEMGSGGRSAVMIPRPGGREPVMNYRFRLSIKTRGIALDGEALVADASREKAEAVLRAALADPERWHAPLAITSHPDDADQRDPDRQHPYDPGCHCQPCEMGPGPR
jgi:hypothetical protein